MNLPPIPAPPHVDLPSQLIIPLETLAALWAAANIILGFIYLLYGLKIFRVMTTITAVLWGAALGVQLGPYIDSIPVAVIFCGAALGAATWFYTRWMVTLPIGLGVAAIAWLLAKCNGINPLACFFIALAAAVAAGGPVLMFYRTIAMAITCLQGAVLVVVGTSITILLFRQMPLTMNQVDLNSTGHILLATICIALLAIPAFYFQSLRYAAETAEGEAGEAGSAKESVPKRKAA